MRGCLTLLSDLELWTFLDEGQQTRVKAFVMNLPQDEITYVEELLQYEPLAGSAGARVAKMTLKDFNNAFFFIMPSLVRERLIEAYAASASFEEANSWGHVIQGSAVDLERREVKQILETINKNGQIKGSFQLRPVVQALRKSRGYSDAEFNALLVDNGLDEFVA
jgi:hypothetical protein